VNWIRPKRAPLRLDPDEYDNLRYQVLGRDGWRCQSCGTMSNLEVHHQEFRSQSGDDSEQNLITLCSTCHANVHRSCGEDETSAASKSALLRLGLGKAARQRRFAEE